MENTVCTLITGDIRMMFFKSIGFSMREFEARRSGTNCDARSIEYYREYDCFDLRYRHNVVMVSAAMRRCVRILQNEFSAMTVTVARVSTGGWSRPGAW